ncbi:MAG: right-handed parallel beta-helix repeat-containing protein [Candidatus Thorarchaeota archaeon]
MKIGPRQILAVLAIVSLVLVMSHVTPDVLISTTYPTHPSKHSQSVISSQVIEETTLLVSEWIIVEAGMDLIINNSTIVFIQDEMAIIVQDGGNLVIRDSLLYSYPSCSWWISAESGAELVIEQSTLTGSGTNTHGGISVGCDNAVIDGCNISEFGGDGINIGDCTGVRIQNNVVTSCSWEIIGFARTSDLIISGNQLSDSGYCGIFGTGSEDVIIRENNVSTTTYAGICLDRTELTEVVSNCISETRQSSFSIEYCNNITVMNNTVLSSYGCGISSIWSTQLFLAYNDIRETVYDGIGIKTHSDGVTVVGNKLHEIYSCGLVSDSSNNILVYGNLMEGVHLSGIDGIGGSENITALVNTFLDCGVGLNFIDATGIVAIGNWVNGSLYNDVNTRSSVGTIYLNAFCSTDIQIGDTTLSPIDWDNGTMGNYWKDYIGRDFDDDGIGDIPYELTSSNWDNHPIVNLDFIHEFRSNYDISAYFWIPVGCQTNETTTDTFIVTTDYQTETLLIFNSSIQIFCVGVLLIILKRRYAT